MLDSVLTRAGLSQRRPAIYDYHLFFEGRRMNRAWMLIVVVSMFLSISGCERENAEMGKEMGSGLERNGVRLG